MSFAFLPTELYSAILVHLPPSSLQQTVLSISRALPLSPIPLSYLFQSVHLTRPEQAILLYNRLRGREINGTKNHEQAASWVREFSLESWSADADVVINLLRLLPNLQSLSLWIGPNNFSPEHLEELLWEPIPGLRYLALRFRPYVQKATYYQFLKGAYFDSTLLALSRWPSSMLPTLSIVQDPLDPGISSKQAFAQPIVFFRLNPFLSVLLHSPSLSSSLKYLRLRLPSRPIARSLCVASAPGSEMECSEMRIPGLQYLDVSTCGVLEGEVDMILVRFKQLRHLVVDDCAILKGDLREGEWAAIGKRCALVGVRRAKEREKKLKLWLETQTTAIHSSNDDGDPDQPTPGQIAESSRRVRAGRRGLASATISFRDRSPQRSSSNAQVSSNASRTKGFPKIRILPPLPELKSLSTTPSSLIPPDKYPVITAEFDAGWAEGIAQLSVTRARLRSSASNGVRVVKFTDDDCGLEEGMDGLEDIDLGDDEAFGMPNNNADGVGLAGPVLCLVGASREAKHAEGCGHSMGLEIWKDEL